MQKNMPYNNGIVCTCGRGKKRNSNFCYNSILRAHWFFHITLTVSIFKSGSVINAHIEHRGHGLTLIAFSTPFIHVFYYALSAILNLLYWYYNSKLSKWPILFSRVPCSTLSLYLREECFLDNECAPYRIQNHNPNYSNCFVGHGLKDSLLQIFLCFFHAAFWHSLPQ